MEICNGKKKMGERFARLEKDTTFFVPWIYLQIPSVLRRERGGKKVCLIVAAELEGGRKKDSPK